MAEQKIADIWVSKQLIRESKNSKTESVTVRDTIVSLLKSGNRVAFYEGEYGTKETLDSLHEDHGQFLAWYEKI